MITGVSRGLGEVIKGFGVEAGDRISRGKSVGFLLGIWRGKVIPLNNVMLCWTEGLLKLLGVWFGLGLQIEKHWSGDEQGDRPNLDLV